MRILKALAVSLIVVMSSIGTVNVPHPHIDLYATQWANYFAGKPACVSLIADARDLEQNREERGW